MAEHFYGEAPTEIAPLDLSGQWHEFMHYLYLPVRIPLTDAGVRSESDALGVSLRYGRVEGGSND